MQQTSEFSHPLFRCVLVCVAADSTEKETRDKQLEGSLLRFPHGLVSLIFSFTQPGPSAVSPVCSLLSCTRAPVKCCLQTVLGKSGFSNALPTSRKSGLLFAWQLRESPVAKFLKSMWVKLNLLTNQDMEMLQAIAKVNHIQICLHKGTSVSVSLLNLNTLHSLIFTIGEWIKPAGLPLLTSFTTPLNGHLICLKLFNFHASQSFPQQKVCEEQQEKLLHKAML